MDHPDKYPKSQYLLLSFLHDKENPVEISEIVAGTGVDQVFISADAQVLSEKGLIALDEQEYTEFSPGKKASDLTDNGFPERKIITALDKAGGSATIKDIAGLSGLEPKSVGETLKILSQKKWAKNEKGTLILDQDGKNALNNKQDDELIFEYICENSPITADDIKTKFSSWDNVYKSLSKRKDFVKEKNRKIRKLSLTKEGRQIVDAGISERIDVSQITSELLIDGKWRDVEFKKYDVSDEPAPVFPGKIHPFEKVLSQTRKVFLEMGFEEVLTPYVESGFWDFDALFQPQDHPAREMQDTFFLERPHQAKLPDKKTIEEVKNTHETGGKTGSIGWNYKWDINKARQTVLRTHTTATTIRSLAEKPVSPRKVFTIGRVFRREAIDYKHLPVFYQVDGIVIDKSASFATLLGVLSEFYKKMGFKKFHFRPAFFPYTEPSVEIFVYLEKKQDWVEMGGAGVFRPEVTLPFGCKDPVLAWGLGLERLAMFKYDISDIRQIYLSDIKWLREVPLCQ